MDIHRQANVFFKLCSKLDSPIRRQAQEATPNPDIAYNQDLTDFAFDAMEWKGADGASADVSAVNEAGKQMYNGISNRIVGDIIGGASKLVSLLRDGGGELGARAVSSLALAKQLFPVKAPVARPALVISKQYYELLSNLEGLAKQSVDPMNLAQVQKDYDAMKTRLDSAEEQTQFLDATVSSGKASKDTGQRETALSKEKELNSFNARMDRAKKTIEQALGASTAPVEESV